MTDKEIILFCIEKIEETFAHGSSSRWTHQHFVLLSDTIEKQTGVLISATTLKRFFGKRLTDAVYTPQIGTRDALSKYAGFADWQDLSIAANASKEVKPDSTNRNRFRLQKKYVWLIVCVSVIIIGSIFFYKKLVDSKIPSYQISIRNPKDTVPFTAVFDYSIAESAKDTFFLNIPELGRFPLSYKHQVFNQWFKYGGFFSAKLEYNGQVLDTLTIHAINEKWQAGIWRYDDNGQFEPLNHSTVEAHPNGTLYVSPQTMHKNGIDSLSRYWTEFRLFQDFNTQLDACSFSTIARNNAETGGKPCYDIDIELVGENGQMQVVFTQEKCFRYVKLRVSDITYDGRDNDLSSLSTNLEKWTNFEISIKNQKAYIAINNTEVFSINYNKPLGSLNGIIIRFFGSGELKRLAVKGENEDIKYAEDFTTNN